MDRQEINEKILEKLEILVRKFPDWRFGQILQNAGIVDRCDCFYIDSETSLNNLNDWCAKMNIK